MLSRVCDTYLEFSRHIDSLTLSRLRCISSHCLSLNVRTIKLRGSCKSATPDLTTNNIQDVSRPFGDPAPRCHISIVQGRRSNEPWAEGKLRSAPNPPTMSLTEIQECCLLLAHEIFKLSSEARKLMALQVYRDKDRVYTLWVQLNNRREDLFHSLPGNSYSTEHAYRKRMEFEFYLLTMKTEQIFLDLCNIYLEATL